MSLFVAAAIRSYAAELARLERTDTPTEALDQAAALAIESNEDLPYAMLVQLLERLARSGPADIGLRCGSARRLAELGIVGHAIASSRTLGEALQIALAHGAASDRLREIRYQTRGGDWVIDVKPMPGLPIGIRRLVCEEWMTAFFAHLAEVTKVSRPPARIELDYAALPDLDYARWLPAMPIFGARRCRLILPAELLKRRLVSYDQDMLHLILRHFAERPAERSRSAERVRRYLVLNGSAPPRLAAAAAEIGTSTRTLVRRLEKEGTSFSQLLDEHRRGYALALARDDRMKLKQISAALGYRSEQSFKRAFVAWTGKPLGQWRREAGVTGG